MLDESSLLTSVSPLISITPIATTPVAQAPEARSHRVIGVDPMHCEPIADACSEGAGIREVLRHVLDHVAAKVRVVRVLRVERLVDHGEAHHASITAGLADDAVVFEVCSTRTRHRT